MARIIMHIDLNAFFATCEVIRDPSLKGKPLVVGSVSRRGIVSTASYEARKYRIHSAMPMYQALRLCPSLIVKEGDFSLYRRLSNCFFDFLQKNVTTMIEIASIDECFCDMTDVLKNCSQPISYLKALQKKLYEETGLSCSIGIAPTKFLAKMASDMKKPRGITILRIRDLARLLWPLPIQSMYGVGKKTYPRLEKLGIYTIGDLAHTQSLEVKKVLGKQMEVLIGWANGKGSDQVQTEEEDPKSIGSSSTFLFDTNTYDEIKISLKEQVKEVVRRLTREQKVATCVTITWKDSDFHTSTRSKTVSMPLTQEEEIYRLAMELFDKHYDGELIRLIGVSVSHLVAKDKFYVQMNLFDMERHQKEAATKLLIEELNRKAKQPYFTTAKAIQTKGAGHGKTRRD